MSTERKRARARGPGTLEQVTDLVEALRGVGVEEAPEVEIDGAELGFAGFENPEAFAGGDDASAGRAGLDGAPEYRGARRRAVDGDERLGETSDAGHDDVGGGGIGQLDQTVNERWLEEGNIAGGGEGEGRFGPGEAAGEAGKGAGSGELVVDDGQGHRGVDDRETLVWGADCDDGCCPSGCCGIDDPLEKRAALEQLRSFVPPEAGAAAASEDYGDEMRVYGHG